MSNIPSISIWVPVISVAIGGSIALLASFGTAYFNHNRKLEIEKDTRQRDRLEKLYKVLISIERENFNLQSEVIQKVHYDKSFSVPESKGDLPSMIQLEMLVSLYFPELTDDYKKLEKARHNFGELFTKALMGELSSKTKEEKQKFCGDVIVKDRVVALQVKEMKSNIAKITKT